MARVYPANETEFKRINGVGEKKLAEFGKLFLGEITGHLQSNPRQIFADDAFDVPRPLPPRRSKLTGTVLETLRMFRAGKSVESIARQRTLTAGTILGHLATAVEAGESIDLGRIIDAPGQAEIESALKQHPGVALSPVFQALGERHDYGLLRLVRAVMFTTASPGTSSPALD
jgi:ATP-dependent DNA helicase RecQ